MQYGDAMTASNSGNHDGCLHPRTEKEFYLGSATGDVSCTTCGESWSKNDPDRPR